jgi:hypothetical protein
VLNPANWRQRTSLPRTVRRYRGIAAVAKLGATREGVLRGHIKREDGSCERVFSTSVWILTRP